MNEIFAEKYKLLALLGKGGMCEVYRAEQLFFDRMVAIKLLRQALAKSEEARRRFLREAQNCSRLDHPNIIVVYDVDQWKDRPYIAMQYVDGGNLNEFMQRGYTASDGLRIVIEVAKALDCASDLDLSHRDLKPENILIASDGRSKVADWGLAKALDGAQDLTNAGVVLGTPEYMSPEQIMSQALSLQSDIYSLGVILYEVMAGSLPFESDSVTDLLQAHIHKEPDSLSSKAPYIPEELSILAKEMLAKSAQDRPSSVKQVIERLESIEAEHGKALSEKKFKAASSSREEGGGSSESDDSRNLKSKRTTKKSRLQLPADGHPTSRFHSKTLVILIATFSVVLIVLLSILLFY